jgi:hypothetical protein
MTTLQDAADYILQLPKAEQKLPEWEAATEALIMAAEGRGPLLHACVGVLRASIETLSGCSIQIARIRIGASGS